MKENQRKCFKCGCSPADDPDVKLYRFPRPGVSNMLRCELWAKYCFPDQQCSMTFLNKLFSEHRMLCHKHFKTGAFIDFSKKLLHRYAVPEEEEKLASTSYDPVAIPGSSRQVLKNILNQLPETSQPGSSSKTEADPIAGPSQVLNVISKQLPKPPLRESKIYKKCRSNLKKVCQLRKQIQKLKSKVALSKLDTNSCVRYLSDKITPSLAVLLEGDIKNFKRKGKGRRWEEEEKIIALRIYKRSPTCYRLLRRLITLPAPGTLQSLLAQFPLQVGINNKIFELLKNIVSEMKNTDNEFVLLFDEMSIRKHLKYNMKLDIIEGHQDHAKQGRSHEIATHALVFMICGIRKKIKQPVAFYLSGSFVTADRLSVLIKEVLNQCFEANVNITATVCDMDGVNRRALHILGATSDNPRLTLATSRTVISFYDTPHLLKCFRNLFLKYDVEHLTDISSNNSTGKGIAKWKYIKDFYDLDNSNPNFVFAPSLRQDHINPNSKQKMRVKLAAQVLSHSVAAGMYCKISQGELPTEATVTANLVAKMDKLFDVVNSDTPDLRRGKPYSTNMTNKTPHLELLKEQKTFFKNLKFIGCRSKPPSLDGWVWSINALELYWHTLKSRNPGTRSLATRRLQQDPLENLFGSIRGLCGSNYNPTAGQFIAALNFDT